MTIIEIILKLLELILAWPVAVFSLVLIFIIKFSNSIKMFLENIKSMKAGPVEFTQRERTTNSENLESEISSNLEAKGVTFTPEQINNIEQSITDLSNQVETKITESQNKDNIIKYLVERSELLEFRLLDRVDLATNTKNALNWFYLQINRSSTKDNFKLAFSIPVGVPNIEIEKEAVFNALLVHNLIEDTHDSLYKITDKGERFLKFINLIR
jgi:hypothetical protein